jgi:hypothetical protein
VVLTRICSLLAGVFLPLAASSDHEFVDDTIHVDLPVAWTLEGGAGEYRLESTGAEVASLLLLPPGSERTLLERLADIEEQFLSTGLIRLEAAESRREDGEEILYRRYRLVMAGTEEEDADKEEAASILLHQYSFWRGGLQVLLQVETDPGPMPPEDLAFRVFHTLEVRKAPDPFTWVDPLVEADSAEADREGPDSAAPDGAEGDGAGPDADDAP